MRSIINPEGFTEYEFVKQGNSSTDPLQHKVSTFHTLDVDTPPEGFE